jgi:hypothetical protein
MKFGTFHPMLRDECLGLVGMGAFSDCGGDHDGKEDDACGVDDFTGGIR